MSSPERGNDGGEDAVRAVRLRRVFAASRKGFRRAPERVAVDDLSLTVPRGQLFGILGPNGAGKTTTVKIIATLLTPTAGAVQVCGHDVASKPRAVRSVLGVVLGGDRGFYNRLSGRENLAYFGALHGLTRAAIRRRLDRLVPALDLGDFIDNRVEVYSRGMRQRLHLARALVHDPSVLILDEPTIGLDPVAAVAVRGLIRRLVPERTVVLTTHDMREAEELCDRVAIIKKGRIAAVGAPASLRTRTTVRSSLIVTTGPVGTADESYLERMLSGVAGVDSVTVSAPGDGRLRVVLQVDDCSAAVAGVVAAIHRLGCSIDGIRFVEPSLEDVFLSVARGPA
jgi:ABC-2 type transport system ATP-binding protein